MTKKSELQNSGSTAAIAAGSAAPGELPKAPTGEEVPSGGLEKIEAAEALGADPPNPGGTVIGGEGTGAAQQAEAAGGDPLAAEAPQADAAVSGDGGGQIDNSGSTAPLTGEQRQDAALEQQFRDAQVQNSEGRPDPHLLTLADHLERREGFTPGEDETPCSAAQRVIQEQDQEIEHLQRQLASAKGQVTRAKASAGPVQRKPRRIGCMPEVMEEEGRAAMRDRVDEALRTGGVTIVASDGEREVTAFEPVKVTADPWRMHLGRKLHTERILLEPGDISSHVEVTGFGLVDEDGEQIAWSPLAEPIVVQPNTRVAVENAIAF